MGIGGAAAEIAAHILADVGVRLRMALFDTGYGAEDLARRAIAALEGVVIDKGLLHGVQRAIRFGQALNRRNLAPHRDSQGEAGKHAAAVDQDSAGAALPMIAAFFHAGQTRIFPKRIQQRGADIYGKGVRRLIDVELDLHQGLRRLGQDRCVHAGPLELRCNILGHSPSSEPKSGNLKPTMAKFSPRLNLAPAILAKSGNSLLLADISVLMAGDEGWARRREKNQRLSSIAAPQETIMKTFRTLAVAAAILSAAGAANAETVVKHIQSEKSPIAAGVWAGDTYYLSGQLADPVTPADAAKGTPAVYGDTAAQSASVFAKIKKALEAQGLSDGDVVKMTVFLGPDPTTGKLDFKGMMSEYVKYYGTAEQPNKPARSAFQVAALAAPWALIEVEVIAVKSK